MIDYHIHTAFSGDGEVSMARMAQAALDAGIRELCFTEHIDIDLPSHIDFGSLDIPAYKAEFDTVRRGFPTLNLRFGIEAGLDMATASRMEARLSAQPLDFVVGSLHAVFGYDPYYKDIWETYTQREVYEEYLRASAECAASCDFFDVLGHLGYIGKFFPHENRALMYAEYGDAIDEVLKTLIARGKGLEISTGGLLVTPHTMPEKAIAARYHELGGEIVTVGSDAHHENRVGHAVPLALQMLKDLGFRYVCAFDQRRPRFIPIP